MANALQTVQSEKKNLDQIEFGIDNESFATKLASLLDVKPKVVTSVDQRHRGKRTVSEKYTSGGCLL